MLVMQRAAQIFLSAFVLATPALMRAADAAPTTREIGTTGPFSMTHEPACIESNGQQARKACLPPVIGQEPAQVHESRAILLFWLADYDAAREELMQALAVDPASAETLLLAGRFALTDYLVRGTQPALAEAKDKLEAARKLAPDSPDVRATQAYVALTEGHRDAALAEFEAVLANAPDHVFALQQRAILRSSLGRLDEAISDYGRAIAAAPDDCADLRFARAELLLKKGNPIAAVVDLNAVLEGPIGTTTELALVDRAGAFERLGNDVAAARDLSSLIDGLADGLHFALGDAEIAGFLMRRTMAFAHLSRETQAKADVARFLTLADKPKLLRLQIFLRRQGFTDLQIDGRPSLDLQHAMEQCLAQAACSGAVGERI
jgi:tetratricopeptide (TPR) repeat protein